MVIKKPGRITDRITLLGREESCVYLINGGKEYALLGGGMPYIIPDMLAQLEKMGVEEQKIKRLVIHHAHFDHIGVAPYFKKRWPWLKVTASERARELLSTPKVIKNIVNLSRGLLAEHGMEDRLEEFGFDLGAIEIDEVVSDNDILPCGDVSLKIISTPGHSSCALVVYIPEEKALSASDSGGIPFGDRIFDAANSNFDLYQQSLEKMAAHDVQIHMAEHFGAYLGEDGRNFLQKSIKSAKETRKFAEEVYLSTRDEKKTAQELLARLMKGAPDNFLPQEVIAMVVGQMTSFLAKKLTLGDQAAS
ncbi:MAG: MBL fold metallo-hydrolase [Thermodesulfobacteriota bacterium]|nr:MBL fold metallo-hydrolase [Thermodesulfobacteriota bacterium]